MRTLFLLPILTILLVPSLPGQLATNPAPAQRPSVATTVVVLGSPAPVSLGDSASSVVTMDTQVHPLATSTLEDYLRSDASIDIQQRGGANTQADLSIRGTSFEQTLVLLNGFRINDAETSHFNLDLPVPLEAIHTIDVLHGAGSTLYGSDAIGGVVDFTTSRPSTTSLQLRTGGGSFGENLQSVLATLATHRVSQVVSGTRDHSDGFTFDRDYTSSAASSETRVDTPLGETDLLFAGSDRPFGANQFYGPYDSYERTKGWFAAASQPLGEKTSASVGYRRHADIFILFVDNPGFYKNQHLDENWQTALRRHDVLSKDTTLYYGLEENTDAIQSTSLGHHGRNQGAGYVDLDLRTTQRGTLSVGLREEVLSGGRSVLSPQAAGSYWLRHGLKARASVGYGFRLPTYVDLYYADPVHIPNPNLKPESAWNYEGGLDWYLGSRFRGSATVFYSRQSNAIDYVRANATQPYQAQNLTGLHFTGVEASAEWHPASAETLQASWTLLFGAQQALNGLQSAYIFNYPTNNASLRWSQSLPQGVFLHSQLNVVQRYQQTAYPVLGAALARESGRVHPFVQFANLTNTGYQEIAGVPMPGRSITGGVELLLTRSPR